MTLTGGARLDANTAIDSGVKGASKPFHRRRRVWLVAGVVFVGGLLLMRLGASSEPEAASLVEEMPGRSALFEARAAAAPVSAAEAGPASSPTSVEQPPMRYPVRGEVAESDALVMFPTLRRGRDIYDPQVFFRRPAGLDFSVRAPEHPDRKWRVVTNELGLTQDWELAQAQPDLRVLVIGDSQASGVCPYPESIPGRLHARFAEAYPDRSIEVVNASKGAWTFHNYLGMLERMREYEPDVVVIVSYSGNDYAEGLLLHHYLASTAPPRHSSAYKERVRSSIRGTNGAVTHSLVQAHHLAAHPMEEGIALGSAQAVTEEILAVCRADEIVPIFVNVPSPFETQPAIYAENVRAVLDLLELEESALAVTRRLADGWMGFLAQEQALVVDALDLLAPEPEPMFWFANHHLNSSANKILAGALFPLIERELDPQR